MAPETPVITISGLCATGTSEPNCKTVITKAEFDKILSARGGDNNVPPQIRRQAANEYTQLLTAANEARKLGVDKDPTFEERMQLVRTQLLAQGAARKLAEASKPTAQEVDTYYAENGSRFEEITLRRIYLPKPSGTDATGVEQPAEHIDGQPISGTRP